MRLGGPVFDFVGAEQWIKAHRAAGYRAAFWPNPPEAEIDEYVKAAGKAKIVIAEVGAWSNPMSPDETLRKKALAHCQEQLAVADRVGARCCVNIAGSIGENWAGPSPQDLTPAAFEKIVETTRLIIDAVKPTRSYYTLETMPWMYPDSVESYRKLIAAIDRARFAVHFDAVNLVNCPARYFRSDLLIKEAIEALGPLIRSCHAKDILLQQNLTTHLDEVVPGTGNLAYPVLLQELAKLDPDTPLMLEHLEKEDYPKAAQFLRETASLEGIQL
jgi:sugar phosphate isomerase/epimerase